MSRMLRVLLWIVTAMLFVACSGRSSAAQPAATSAPPPTTASTNPPTASTAVAEQPTDTTAAATEQATDTPTAQPGPVKAKVGERAVLPGVAITVTKVEQNDGTDADQPQAGNKFVIVHLIFENTGNERLSVQANQFEFEDSSGVLYNSLENFSGNVDQLVPNKFDSYTLAPGGKLQDKTVIIQLKPDQMQGLQLLFQLDDQHTIQVDLGL